MRIIFQLFICVPCAELHQLHGPCHHWALLPPCCSRWVTDWNLALKKESKKTCPLPVAGNVLHWSLQTPCRRGLLQPSPATTWWVLHRSSGGWNIHMQVYRIQQHGASQFQFKKYTKGFLAPITKKCQKLYSPAPRCSPASQSASLRSPLLWKSSATLFSLQSGVSSWPIMTSPFEIDSLNCSRQKRRPLSAVFNKKPVELYLGDIYAKTVQEKAAPSRPVLEIDFDPPKT